MEQRVCIKVCANLGKSATKTLAMIQQALGDQSLIRAQVFQWHARFKTGHTIVDDDQCTGRLKNCTTPETVTQIQELVRQDRRGNIRDIADEVVIVIGMPTDSDGRIWHAPCRSQICAQDPDS